MAWRRGMAVARWQSHVKAVLFEEPRRSTIMVRQGEQKFSGMYSTGNGKYEDRFEER